MPGRDYLDLFAGLTIAALVLCIVVLTVARPAPEKAVEREAVDEGAALAGRQQAEVAGFLAHLGEAVKKSEKAATFVKAHPGNAAGQLALGDALFAEGDLGGAAMAYRRAVEGNRAYADSRSSAYRGDDLKKLVDEGLEVYRRERTQRPDDERVKEVIRDLYYLQRTLSGGCD